MKIDGVIWTTTKNQNGLYTSSTGKLSLTGQKSGNEIINSNRDSVDLNRTYTMAKGSITVNYIKGGSLKVYTLASSNPKTRGFVTSRSLNESKITNVKYPEVDFSGLLFVTFNVDSIIISQRKAPLSITSSPRFETPQTHTSFKPLWPDSLPAAFRTTKKLQEIFPR